MLTVTIVTTAFSQQLSTKCPSDNVCYSINVPDSTAASGQGDIYFQIKGPSTKQWIGFGQGGAMKNSNIFIIFADETGSNVTLSPRLGNGEIEPKTTGDEAKVVLLEGSGIANGTMIANVRCKSLTCSQDTPYFLSWFTDPLIHSRFQLQ